MKFSFNWLKNWINVPVEINTFASDLTRFGLEVESVSPLAPDFQGVVVGEVISCEAHPDADRLKITQIAVGQKDPLQIVCGASNVKKGIKVPCAKVGAQLPGAIKIKQARLRNVVSHGMLCSAKELGLKESVDGLMILPDDAPIGEDIRNYLQLDDYIIEIKSTPNRADCLSICGLSRETAALFKEKENELSWCTQTLASTCDKSIAVNNSVPKACGRFVHRLIERVKADTPTPLWIKERLERSGIMPLEFLIDVTNYVMLELGQPMHVFDADKLVGPLAIRYAKNGETIELLGDKKVILTDHTLVISDSKKPGSLAGIKGGKATAVDKESRNILLESAFFYPESIAGKSRYYTLTSESAYRFERGVDYKIQAQAMERATELIVKYAGGRAGPRQESTGILPKAHRIIVRKKKVEAILGVTLPWAEIFQGLSRLELCPSDITDESFVITSPSFRFDITKEIDIIEEIARLFGYDHFPLRPLKAQLSIFNPEKQLQHYRIRRRLAALGYQETVNYAFIDPKLLKDFAEGKASPRVLNPIEPMSQMRSTLLPSLLSTLKYNLNRKQSRVRIYEYAKVFINQGQETEQPYHLATLVYGDIYPSQWGEKKRPVDFFDLKNDLTEVLQGVPFSLEANNEVSYLHPGRSAIILIAGEKVGVIGSLHPLLMRKLGLPMAPLLFEFNADLIKTPAETVYQPLSKFQPIERDLAFIVPNNISAEQLLSTLAAVKLPIKVTSQIFDLYQGEGLGPGEKSIALHLNFLVESNTIKDEDIEAWIDKLIASAASLGAKLR